MKVKVITIINGIQALVRLGEVKLPPYPTAYRVGKAIAAVQSAQKEIEMERGKIYFKHGVPSEDGKSITVPNEKMEEFNKEIAAWMDTEMELNCPQILPSEIGNVAVEPAIISPLLGWVIIDVDAAAANSEPDQKK